MKHIKTILILSMLLALTTIPSYASLDWEDISGQAGEFINRGENNPIELGDVGSLINGLSSILVTIGVTVVLAGILIIGIKYMTATPEEAAKIKTKLVGLVIAGIVIIASYGIWQLAYLFFTGASVNG